MKIHPLLSCLLLITITSSCVTAATWTFDKVHSQVNFSVTHMVISEVTGMFNDFDVTLEGDATDISNATIEAKVKASSISTGNGKRDEALRSDDFLNAEKFPELKFKSTSVEKTGSDTYKTTGSLTIRDVTKTVVLETRYKGSVRDTKGGTRVAFKATTTINRFDYGVKWDAALETGQLVVGPNVEITLLMEFRKE